MFDPKVHVGVAVFIGKGPEYLMLQRSESATHGAGLWSIPGGWVDYGESPEEACARELNEEAGIIARPNNFILVGAVSNTYPEQDMHAVCLFYEWHATDIMPEFRNMEPEKHIGMRYRSPYKIDPEQLFPPLRTYLARLRGEAA